MGGGRYSLPFFLLLLFPGRSKQDPGWYSRYGVVLRSWKIQVRSKILVPPHVFESHDEIRRYQTYG